MEPLVEPSFKVEETDSYQAVYADDSPVQPLVLHPPHYELVYVTLNGDEPPQVFALLA